MKTLLSIILVISVHIVSVGQNNDMDIVKQLEILKARIDQLCQENSKMVKESRTRDSLQYCSMRREIFGAYNNIGILEFDFGKTVDNIALTGLFTKLMQANNPSSDILGFRFTEIIYSACEKHFIQKIENPKEKKRFGQTINKILGSPIVSSLANTNPFTSVVAAIISTIAGFTTTVIETKREGNRIKEIEAENRDLVSQESILAFKNDLHCYIEFYDKLIIASTNYLEGLDRLNQKYATLNLSVMSYKEKLYSVFDLDEKNKILVLTAELPDPNIETLEFSRFVTDNDLSMMLSEARKFPVLYQSVCDFKSEYNRLLLDFLTRQKETLELSKDFPKGTVDPARIDSLLKDIENFMDYYYEQNCMDQGFQGAN